jgi:hypothetical protein
LALAYIGLLALFLLLLYLWSRPAIQSRARVRPGVWAIPGFRSGTWWKAGLASVFYVFVGLGVAVGIALWNPGIALGYPAIFLVPWLLAAYIWSSRHYLLLGLQLHRLPTKDEVSGWREKPKRPTRLEPAQAHSPADSIDGKAAPAIAAGKSAERKPRFAGELPVVSLEERLEVEVDVSKRYPFPIAYGYRLLTAIVNTDELYRQQMRVAENILAFLGSTLLALLSAGDRQKLDLDLRELWSKGISPGDWRDICTRCLRIFASAHDDSLAEAFVRLGISSQKTSVGRCIQYLIQAKNDFKHDRWPLTEEDFAQGCAETQLVLVALLKDMQFLADHPIREVKEIDTDRHGSVKLTCLVYRGDHPGFAQETLEYGTPLHRGDLYLERAPDHWVSLYPFIQPISCSRCKSKEVFFVDKWLRGEQKVLLKSFDRGHVEESSDTAVALSHWQSGS